ncbi:MAG: leucine-rich repeat domain-containing protein [Treponema sp.]|nr:leucine-rich repeat domain-containing protein [Treponema sp.]
MSDKIELAKKAIKEQLAINYTGQPDNIPDMIFKGLEMQGDLMPQSKKLDFWKNTLVSIGGTPGEWATETDAASAAAAEPAVQPSAPAVQPQTPVKYVPAACGCGKMPTEKQWFCTVCGARTGLAEPFVNPALDPSNLSDKWKIGDAESQIKKFEKEKTAAEETANKYNAAKVYKDGFWLYKINGNCAVITGYEGTSASVEIPAQVNGIPVLEIGESALSNKKFTKVTIPAGIVSIGRWAFHDNKLTAINIPGSVTTVAESAFAKNELESIVLGEGIKEIGEEAFTNVKRINNDTSKIANVIIPGSIKKIGKKAFFSIGAASITISAGVQSIGEDAFRSNQLKEVTIPEGVSEIGDGAFFANFITKVSFPNSLTKIGEWAFAGSGSKSLGNKIPFITLPPNLKTLGEAAFKENKLTEITIPSGVKTIGKAAFESNELVRVTICDGVTTIGAEAFKKNKLANITLPPSVTTIKDKAFSTNELSGNITIPETVKKIGEDAYIENKLTGVEIRGATEIGKSAFPGMEITKVILGSRVISVGRFAFSSKLIIGATVPASVKLDENAFHNQVYVARGDSKDISFDNTKYWQDLEKMIKADKEARTPAKETAITCHDASGKLIGSIASGDYRGWQSGGDPFRTKDITYRNRRGHTYIYTTARDIRFQGQIFVDAPYNFDDDSCVIKNFASMTAMGGEMVQIDSAVTSDGVVLSKGDNKKSFPRDDMIEAGVCKTGAKAAELIEEYKIGTVKVEGNVGVAYNKAGVKVGEVRNAREFSLICAGALLRFLIKQ